MQSATLIFRLMALVFGRQMERYKSATSSSQSTVTSVHGFIYEHTMSSGLCAMSMMMHKSAHSMTVP